MPPTAISIPDVWLTAGLYVWLNLCMPHINILYNLCIHMYTLERNL